MVPRIDSDNTVEVGGGGTSEIDPRAKERQICAYPHCRSEFARNRFRTRFCCEDCRVKYWLLAQRVGDQVLSGNKGKPHGAVILDLLREADGAWVCLRRELPYVYFNSRRISDLKAEGHKIESTRFEGQVWHRLVEEK